MEINITGTNACLSQFAEGKENISSCVEGKVEECADRRPKGQMGIFLVEEACILVSCWMIGFAECVVSWDEQSCLLREFRNLGHIAEVS